MLTETALRTGCLNAFTSLGSREHIDPAALFERLLLVIYAYGTNTGIRAVAAGDHPHSEDDLRYIRRRYFTIEACRELPARSPTPPSPPGKLAVGRRHHRGRVRLHPLPGLRPEHLHRMALPLPPGKRGVLIYWTVETAGAMAMHSQLIPCSASEVHAMVEGAMRHGTDMRLESNYIDTHGASFIGFGITRLLDFDLIARFKQINQMKLYLPGNGDPGAYPLLRPR